VLFEVGVKLGLSPRKIEDVREWGTEEDFWAYERRNNRGIGKIAPRWASLHEVFGKYYWRGQVQDDDIGRACGTCGGINTRRGFGGGTWRKKTAVKT